MPSGYYLPAALIAFFPWSWLLPAALLGARRVARRDPALAFLAAWVIGPWVMLELMASKLPHYLLSTFPAMALLVVHAWERRADRPARGTRAFEAVLFALPALGLAAAGVAAAQWAEDGTVRAGGAALAGVGLVIAIGGTIAVARGAVVRLLPAVAAAGAALLLVLSLSVLPSIEPLRLAPRIGAAVAAHRLPDEPCSSTTSASPASAGRSKRPSGASGRPAT